MILHKLIFGLVSKVDRDIAEEYVEYYISALFHNGQACGEYFTVIENGELCAYINLQNIEASLEKYHCEYGNKWLKKIIQLFPSAPVWKIIDDELPVKNLDWNDAPFLYLFASYDECESPIYRGDNGSSIPLYKLAGTHEDREKVYFWQREYRDLDAIWMRCGDLEVPAYKQLATPVSSLSASGKEICEHIENVTGKPTYYYLMRYWGRRSGEETRHCPKCGHDWNHEINQNSENAAFHQFDFICHNCRLVSHLSVSNEDERHAVIGEWRHSKKSN